MYFYLLRPNQTVFSLGLFLFSHTHNQYHFLCVHFDFFLCAILELFEACDWTLAYMNALWKLLNRWLLKVYHYYLLLFSLIMLLTRQLELRWNCLYQVCNLDYFSSYICVLSEFFLFFKASWHFPNFFVFVTVTFLGGGHVEPVCGLLFDIIVMLKFLPRHLLFSHPLTFSSSLWNSLQKTKTK